MVPLGPTANRILLVGDYMWPFYHDACADALEYHGCAVKRFGWLTDFHTWVEGHSEPKFISFWHRIQYGSRLGPIVFKVNQRLINIAVEFQPKIIWLHTAHLISPRTIKYLRTVLPKTIFVLYTHDNPFSHAAKKRVWRNFRKSIPLFDIHVAHRENDFIGYKKYKVEPQFLMRSYFIPETENPIPREQIPARFICDVVFAGHYENDGRVEMLESICEAGYTLNLFGGGWTAALSHLRPDSPLRAKYPVMPATKVDYQYAICGAKVALCFLSTLNQDTYTTRSFQIPAMKVVMLSQYTDDLASLYQPDVEAVFFKSKSEMLHQLKFLLENEQRRNSIAEAGYKKAYSAGYDVKSRMKFWLDKVLAFQKPIN